MATNREIAKAAQTESDMLPAGGDSISRKNLAGQGRSQEAGTVFGSRWTNEERSVLRRRLAGCRVDPGVLPRMAGPFTPQPRALFFASCPGWRACFLLLKSCADCPLCPDPRACWIDGLTER